MLRSPLSRRDHTRYPEPEAGLLTIEPEEVLRAADELLAEVAGLMQPASRNLSRISSSGAWTGSPAGSASPAASACRWAF